MNQTMKKSLFFVFALFALAFASCNRDEVSALEEEFDSLVELSAARASALGDSVTKEKCKGKLTDVAAADLPAAIKTYLAANYAGAESQYSGKDASGQFVVGIKTGTTNKGLLFNADGTFKQELTRYPKGAKLTKVEVAALPAAITSYVTSKYAGATIKHAGTNADGVYFVAIVQADNTKKVLQFDAKGVFVQEMAASDHPMGAGKPKKRK
jgi:hypothetical protein